MDTCRQELPEYILSEAEGQSRRVELGTFEATPEMFRLVNQVLRSGRISYGPVSQEFEARFAEMHGCKYGVLSNSGTSSLLVALQTLKQLHGWKAGDEVIVPALTFVATLNIVLQLRLRPVLVDVECDYYGMDTEKLFHLLEQKKRKRIRCIIPVHTFGQPCDMATLRGNANFYEVKIIEDSCEAMLANHSAPAAGVWDDRKLSGKVGSWGDIACFSTYAAHLLVTGVGGMATTNDPKYALHMRSLINHGIDLTELPAGEKYEPTWLARKFRFVRPGHSFRLTELESALGVAQLDDLPAMIKKRQDNAAYLIEGLKPYEEHLQLPMTRPNTEHSRMMFVLVCRQDGVRDKLMAHLNRHGIGTRLALPLTNQPVYRGLVNEAHYPVAKWMNERAFYTGIHQGLTREDLDYMIEKVGEFFNGR